MGTASDLTSPFKFVTNGAIDADFLSGAIDLLQLHPSPTKLCIQANAVGSTPTGTFTVVASLDGVNYITLASSSQAITADAYLMWHIDLGAYAYAKLKYVRTSGGTATGLNAWVMAK